MERTICCASEESVGRSKSKDTVGAAGVPSMFRRQFTFVLLCANELPKPKSLSGTELMVYIPFKLSAALKGSPPKAIVDPGWKENCFLMMFCMVRL